MCFLQWKVPRKSRISLWLWVLYQCSWSPEQVRSQVCVCSCSDQRREKAPSLSSSSSCCLRLQLLSDSARGGTVGRYQVYTEPQHHSEYYQSQSVSVRLTRTAWRNRFSFQTESLSWTKWTTTVGQLWSWTERSTSRWRQRRIWSAAQKQCESENKTLVASHPPSHLTPLLPRLYFILFIWSGVYSQCVYTPHQWWEEFTNST